MQGARIFVHVILDQGRPQSHERVGDEYGHLAPGLLGRDAVGLLHLPKGAGGGALRALLVARGAFRGLEVLALLVHGEVREVHLRLSEVLIAGHGIWHRAEPRQALLEEVRSHRNDGGDDNVQPHVELQAFQQEWVCDVALHHILDGGLVVVLLRTLRPLDGSLHIFPLSGENDALALCPSRRLDDKGVILFALGHRFLELVGIVGDDPCLG
mmetsp:Transcript_32646/g.82863  ORF Transcript_32646/g.82863 Transcript_32646/m.82863 type:complete len:212 (+) Transcript_32646:294-929(+)